MSLTQSIHRGKHMYGDTPALVFGGRTTSYRDLYDEVSRCASAFFGLDGGEQVRVGILTTNSDRAIISFYGAIWAGMVPNYLNIRWSAHELSQSIDDFSPSILVVDDTFFEMGRELRDRCPTVESLVYVGERSDLPEGVYAYADLVSSASPLADSSGDMDEMAFLNYTGGTTGKSKGVIHSHATHQAGMNCAIAESFFQRGNAVLVTPLFHISGIAASNCALMMGNSLFILPAFDPEKLLQLIEREKIVQCLLIPTMIKMVVDHPRFDDYELSSFRQISYGGSPIDEALLKEARRRLPGVSFIQIYGQTEGLPATFLHDADHSEAGFASGRTRSAGAPALGTEIEIRDGEGRALDTGEIGEICLRAPYIMLGYLNSPEQTASALREGWLITGDAGYLSEDGFLYVVDRIKDMIVSGGENVYSAEVENALHEHTAVQDCAVIGLPHDTWGEMVHADVVLKLGAAVTVEELTTHCREFIAGYKLPKSVEFVDAIPLTAVGKVDKVSIRVRYSDTA
jgi:long-chain acyl-CoA synthetase